MIAVVALLRAVNVSGRNIVKMDALRDLCKSLGLANPQTHIQSGNIIFGVRKVTPSLAIKIQAAIEKEFDVRTDVILRTAADLRDVISRNPFATRADVPPNKLLVTFLSSDPGTDAPANIRKLSVLREELHLLGRELYIYFPDGSGQSRLSAAVFDRALGVSGTARNWNTVNKLLDLAEKWQTTG